MILTPPPSGGQQILRHALARRWASIVAGSVVGLVVGVVAAFAAPVSHSATVSMTVTSPSPTPAPVVRASLSNTTDMVTEQGIAKSAAVLDAAAEQLGGGLTAADLRSNVEVSGDTNGTIVKIEYVAPTREQAVAAADAISAAYLKERTALVEQRADEMAEGVNEQIKALETELAGLTPTVDEDGNAKDNPRAAEITTELTKLAKEAEQLAPYHATAGRVITSAEASADEVSPSKGRLILITTVVGVFAGLVLVLIRETRSRSLASPTQLADLTALPVWSAEEGSPEPWLAPTRMLAMAIDRDHWVDLIVDASDPQARDLHRVLSASLAETRVPAPRLIDIKQPLASLLDEVRPSRHVLVAVRKGHDLKELHALLDELAIINREVNGMIYLGDQVAASAASAPAAPARSAEVIVPTDEAEAADEDPAQETADAEKASAESAPTKETEDTAESKKSGSKGTTSSKKGKK
ncbi:membrane protein [Isoptericola variabilis]|uniref:membrane protein n=1 Tax=Isoptericola variabilis TaxID=139208 RepID=UPI0006607C79|nr:membrane protein [Isoptericola variabilis]